MKHLAKVQVEFLAKCAAKWEELSYKAQKQYLRQHPKSKRKLTAKPGTDGSGIEFGAYRPDWMVEQLRKKEEEKRDEFAEEEARINERLQAIKELRKQKAVEGAPKPTFDEVETVFDRAMTDRWDNKEIDHMIAVLKKHFPDKEKQITDMHDAMGDVSNFRDERDSAEEDDHPTEYRDLDRVVARGYKDVMKNLKKIMGGKLKKDEQLNWRYKEMVP